MGGGMNKRIRLRFWLFAMDALAWAGLFGSEPYFYCVERAADATDWSEA
jgi:hypothetical protein